MGSFDGVHRGHQALIARMRVLAQTMNAATAVLTFTPHPRLILGKDAGNLRLLCTDGEKSRRLEASGLDRLFFLPFDRHIADCEAEEFLNDWLVERMGVAGMVVGHDHRFGRMRRGNLDMLQDYARSHPAFVVAEQAALMSGTHAQTNAQTNAQAVSSTRIRRALADGQLAEANDMLGYAYSLSGEVVPDRQVGRTLGYPTANVRIDSAFKQLPAPGVYAAYARWGQEQRPAMVYYGGRPAFSGAGFALEVHILDYQGDLYGQILEVSLLQFIRGDLHFDDISSLKAQIYSDEQAIRRFLASAGT
jgi:riboflavin kinase/FMN adenylyltransferase